MTHKRSFTFALLAAFVLFPLLTGAAGTTAAKKKAIAKKPAVVKTVKIAPVKKAPAKTAAKTTSKAISKTPAKKVAAAPAGGVMKPVRRPVMKGALAEAEKPEVKSPDSLEGQVFNRIGAAARLSNGDADRYERIFALQDVGNFKKANLIIAKLDDHRLMGHVLYQRFMGKHYAATYKELADWMRDYADHPGAQKLYDVAFRRKPKKNAAPLAHPRPGRGLVGYHDYDSGQLAQPYLAGQKPTPREKDLIDFINGRLSENPSAARERLDSEEAKTLFQGTKYDALQAQVAQSYFYNDKLAEAYEVAAASANRSGKEVPLAGWVAGLAAWKKKNYEEAARHFESTAMSPRASAWTASGGAYWAARSYLRSHHPEKVSFWLQKAAEHPRSFYGIIAVKALGLEHTRFNWEIPELTDERVDILAKIAAGKRALALMDASHPELAEQEMRQIDPADDIPTQEAMMAFAHTAGEPSFEMRLGSGLENKKGNLYDAALYPDPPWRPQGGYKADRALVHAFIRQESRFDASVSNKASGAAGLMQLLPSTASTVEGRKVTTEQLEDPAFNLRLGQKYLNILLAHDSVRNSLFKLMVAYNAGPGNLVKWERSIDYEGDPLLFIELIPAGETRLFIERVMTNYWIYRLKYKQDASTLETVASGEWPLYKAQDSHLHPADIIDAVKDLGKKRAD